MSIEIKKINNLYTAKITPPHGGGISWKTATPMELNDTYTNLWVTLHLRPQDSKDNKTYTAIFCEKQPVICDDGSIDESSDIQVTGFADHAE